MFFGPVKLPALPVQVSLVIAADLGLAAAVPRTCLLVGVLGWYGDEKCNKRDRSVGR